MGGFDMYCGVCGLPFQPFSTPKYKQRTEWLNYGICEYSKDAIVYKIPVKDYNEYGGFTIIGDLPEALKNDASFLRCIEGGLLVASELPYSAKRCHHAACANRRDDANTTDVASEFRHQYFDEKKFLKHPSLLWLLNKPE